MRYFSILMALYGLSLLIGCRGEPSCLLPVHLNQNMDLQDKYKPQRVSTIFEDGRAMRPPVEGTVGRDILSLYGVKKAGLAPHDDRYLREDDAYWRGLNKEGKPVELIPEALKLDMAMMKRGQERYGIYCTPCHGPTGYGDGLVRTVGKINVPSYHDQYKRQLTAGHIYGVISNGSASGLMKGYKHQISVEDRWAIVAYVRALQRSQYGSESDVPPKPKAQAPKKETL
jgi:mono/diheme cytochrome c family protein